EVGGARAPGGHRPRQPAPGPAGQPVADGEAPARPGAPGPGRPPRLRARPARGGRRRARRQPGARGARPPRARPRPAAGRDGRDLPRSGHRPRSLTVVRTVVVGGGIGGLSVARELTLRGLPVVVLERAPVPAAVGAGIIMNPNAMRVLERNGLADPLRRHGWPYLARDTCDHRGRLLARRDYRPLYAAGTLAVGTLVHRADLHRVLSDALPPGTVRFGARVTGVAVRQDRAAITLESGEALEADLLVGADGIRSLVPAAVFRATAPVYLGYRSHRLVVENRDGIEDFTEFLGRGRRIGLVPISRELLYVWTAFNSRPESTDHTPARPADFRARFAEFADPRVR